MGTQFNVTLLTIDRDTGHTVDIHEETVTISEQDQQNGYCRLPFLYAIRPHLPVNIQFKDFSKDLSGWTLNLPHLPLYWKIITIFEKEIPSQ
jgi:hypothetical protein